MATVGRVIPTVGGGFGSLLGADDGGRIAAFRTEGGQREQSVEIREFREKTQRTASGRENRRIRGEAENSDEDEVNFFGFYSFMWSFSSQYKVVVLRRLLLTCFVVSFVF